MTGLLVGAINQLADKVEVLDRELKELRRNN